MVDKEYIEKEAAIELLRDNIHLPIDSGTARAYWTRVVEIKDALIGHIAKIPAADVAPVVRCINCVYWDGRGWDGRCEAPSNGLIRDYTNYDDFCSYGERKEATPCSK